MNDIPKCSCWFGHNFQPRYDKTASRSMDAIGEIRIAASLTEAFLEAGRHITYVCDVCEHCGYVIKRDKS